MNEESEDAQITAALDEIENDALKGSRGKPALGRIATVQALADLGEGFHSYKEVQIRLKDYVVTGGVYCFDLTRKYPRLFKREGDRVAISEDAYPAVKRSIGKRLAKVKEALKRSAG